jgi:hypothetical protein
MINRQTFYAAVKLNLFKTISEKQKQGMDAILDYWEANGYHDGRHLAYMSTRQFTMKYRANHATD